MKTHTRYRVLLLVGLLYGCSITNANTLKESCEFVSEQQVLKIQASLDDSSFPIVDDGLWGFIDANGGIKIEPQFKDVDQFSEGLAAFKSPWDG